MTVLKMDAEKETKRIEAQKAQIELQLKDVQPLIEEARQAVGAIKTSDLNEIRSLRAPPETIRDILEAVLLFMGILDSSWSSMRRYIFYLESQINYYYEQLPRKTWCC